MRILAAGLLALAMMYVADLGARVNEIDSSFEQLISNACITNTRQIKVPGYRSAYNPSLIPYKDGYLLSFRYRSRFPEMIKNQPRTDASFVGVARLDQNFNVLEETVQLLNIESRSSKLSLTAEDARLFNVGNRIFFFFNDLPPLQRSGKFAMYFGELVEDRGLFVLKGAAKLLNYPFAGPVEKNWSPFASGDRLYVIYSDQPRVILEVDIDTGNCSEASRTISNGAWDYGQVRGGTPAYPVNDLLLTIFHSCCPVKKGKAYVMGAYAFDKEPPFSIRTITPAPLGDLAYYTQENDSKVVYPVGMVVQENTILVSWGKDDKKIFITTFDRKKLLASMEPY